MKMMDKIWLFWCKHYAPIIVIAFLVLTVFTFKESRWHRTTQLNCQVCPYEKFDIVGYYRDACPDCGLNTVDRKEVVVRTYNWKRQVKPFDAYHEQ